MIDLPVELDMGQAALSADHRQMARAVLRLGASQVEAKTGAWPVRLFAAIRQAVERRSDGSDEGPPAKLVTSCGVSDSPTTPRTPEGPIFYDEGWARLSSLRARR